MSSDFYSSDGLLERGSIPLDIDNVHMVLQVEQEQIQKRTFTNWVNAQLAKRRPPSTIRDLFNDFRDGSKLLDLLEVMSGQSINRDKGRGLFQNRSNIEKAITFLKKKSIKLVNINTPDIIDGKPSIILGLIWTIILQYHIEELACCLSFDSRQSSMESLASLDSRSMLSSRSASSSPVPPKGSPLHSRFRVSAKKALLLWVREQCHRAGCSVSIKDFKASWRSGVVFLAILNALRPNLINLSKARTRSNKQNLEEAFHVAETELRIPRLLNPNDVDVRDPDEKSIMTYVAQFLQYSRDVTAQEDEIQYLTPLESPSPINVPVHYTPAISDSPLQQVTPDCNAQEVTCWLVQAFDELLEGWNSTEGESYSERYHVFQTFLVSFNEQRRPIMPLLTAMRRTPNISQDQRSLREAWDCLSEKLREYKVELDRNLPAPLDTVAGWLLRTEGALAEEQGDSQDHDSAADEAREKQELLKICLEEMPQQLKIFQSFQNLDDIGNMMVPSDKIEELKRRFTNVRVTAKYHGIKLEYREYRHTVLDLLGQITTKLCISKRLFVSPEAVTVLLQEWDEMNKQELPSLLEAALCKLKQISEKYSSKSALAPDYHHVSQQVKQLEENTAVVLEEVSSAKILIGRILSAWNSYIDCLSSLQAWLEQSSAMHNQGRILMVTSESMSEWGSRHAHLNELANFLIESTDPQTSRGLAEELWKLNKHWAECVKENTLENTTAPLADLPTNCQDLQYLIREATLILKEPLEAMAGPLRVRRNHLQLMLKKIKEVNLGALEPSAEWPLDQLQKLRHAIPEVMQTLFEAEQVCAELQHSVSGLDTRLAELLLWEMEARELYEVLRARNQQQNLQGQDPRARVVISRGLQLEGQVVTEEQDLQVIIMTMQKTTPIQYLYASAMQKRVQNAVAQSQEAIGLLSSLSARRDKSRSPPEASPLSENLIQAKIMPQHLRLSETKMPTHQSETNGISNHNEEASVPKIVVQQYREEKIMSPSMPNTYAQVAIQIESQIRTCQETNAQKRQIIQDTSQIPQQQPQQDLSKKHEQEKQQPFKYKPEQKLVENKEQVLNLEQPQPCQDKQEQQDGLETICQFKVKQHTLPIVKEETLFKQAAEEILCQQPAPKKKSLSSQELQSRKAQAIKNRPWLQKAAHPERKSPAPSQKTPESQVKVTAQTQQQKEQYQSAREGQQQKKQSQDSKKQPHPPVRQIEPDSGTNNKSQIQSYTKSHVINQSEPKVQANLQSVPQVQIQSRSLVYSCADGPQPPSAMSQTRISQSQKQILPQSHSHGQTGVLYGPHLPLHIPAGTTIRPTSPYQASPPGFIQLPVPSHIQLRSHPQSWGPVRPPSPKPPTTDRPETQGQQSMTLSLPPPQLNKQSQLFAHSVCQPQIPANLGDQAPAPPQPVAYSQAISQSITQAQTHSQQRANVQTNTFSIDQAQNIIGPHQPQPQICHEGQHVVRYQDHSATDPTTLSQSPAFHQGLYSPCQLQAWPQVRPATHMSVQHLQATTQPFLCPEIYPQPRFSAQQCAENQELQNQAIPQQKHPVSQMCCQQIAQGSHSGEYSAAHVLPQWPQQTTQISSHAYVVDLSSTQPQISPQRNTQAWTQTNPQISSQSHVQQSPQKRAYNIAQKEQGLIQQQTWFQPQPQPHTYHQPPSQTYLPAQHLLQRQHHSQPQIQTQIPLPPSPPDQAQSQFSTQYQIHNLQGQSQTQTQTQLQSKPPAKNNQPSSNPLFHQLPPKSTHFQVLSHPVIEIKSVTPPQAKPLGQAELDPATLFELLAQPKGQSSAQLKTKPISDPIPLIATATTILNVETLQIKKEQTPQAQVCSPSAPGIVSAIEPIDEHQVEKRSVVLSPEKPDVESTQQSNVVTRTSSQPTAQSQIQRSVQSVTELKVQSSPVPKPKVQSSLQTQQSAHSPELTKSQTLTQSRVQLPPQTSQPVSALISQIHVESLNLFTKPSSLDQVPSQAYTEAYVKAQALASNHFEEAKHCLQAHIMETISVFKDKCLTFEEASVKEALDPELLAEFLRAAKGMEAFCTPSQLKEMALFTQSVQSQWEACFPADFAEAGQQLETLKQLCGTLSPEDTHHLAQTQLLECEKRVHQGSGEVGTTQKGSKKSSEKLPVSGEVSQVIVQKTVEKKTDIEKQASVEEITKKEALERYETCKRTLQAHLAKNEQNFTDVPSDLISLKALHTRLQEIQSLRQETELLWSEYANQFSQLRGDSSLEQEKAELLELWRSQQTNLQRRGSSLGAALRQIDSTENHLVDFNDRLDRYLRQSKDITGFSLASTNILKDIKELHDNIHSELDQLSRLDPESSDLDPGECFRLTREVETHKASLDQLRQQVQKSEAAARALDQFLISLRKVDDDISGVQGTSCTESVVLQDCRCKLSLIRLSIDSLKEKAPQLDLLLQGARLTVTRDGSPASCLDMVAVLLRSLEEADSGLASQQRGLQKETQSKSFGLRKRITLGELRKLQDAIEKQGLKEPTMPAAQHRLRALIDLEGQLQIQQSEVQSLREMKDLQGEEENLLQDLEMQWEETQRAFFEQKKQCNILLELLKKLQTCRSLLSTTIQKTEQTISDQASYIGKDNLQRSMAKVSDMKEELAGLGETIDDMKGACKRLQSELKKFPDCTDAPFEITEKTDCYMDNLRVGLEMWEKQLMLGGEVDDWARSKLALFSEGNPFSNEQQVLAMRDEIQTNEENIEHFHKKSTEIQEILLSQEAPLELQVMETQLRKRMEQVKESFTDCTDVFEEIRAVRKHLSEKIKECWTGMENIQNCLSTIEASDAKAETQIQDLDADLSSQEEHAEAVLKEVGLLSSVPSPPVLEELSNDCSSLREAIAHTKDIIRLKREERHLFKVISDERKLFEEWFQDLQLSVNECFESPESRSDVETSLQKLTGFINSEDTERRLRQLNDQLERAKQQVSSQQLSEFINWLKEQQEEVATFRAHCQSRQEQMESLLDDLNQLQKQHERLCEWLQDKEKQSVVPENVKLLFKELQDESVRGVALSELLASIRRQGVRAENILKDGDNLLQRYRNLETRLQKQATAQSVLDKEYNRFNSQAESIRTWISDFTQPLTTPSKDNTEEMKQKALAVLSSRPEGDSKINSLLGAMERLCEQEDIDFRRKHDFCLLVRETEDQWRKALQAAEEAFDQAETKVRLEKLLDTFQIHTENLESWIKSQYDILTSLGPHMELEEKLKISKAILSSRPYGESKLHDLRQQYQIISENQGSDGNKRKEICSAVKHAEEQWENLLHDAEVAAKHAESQAGFEREFKAFRNLDESFQSWMREQRQKLLGLGGHMQFEEQWQIVQAVISSKSEGESKLLDLKMQSATLCKQLEKSRKAEVEQLVAHTEQLWGALLETAQQAELQSILDDFDFQRQNTDSWIENKQQNLQCVFSYTPSEKRCHTAQAILSSRPDGDFKVNNLRRRGQTLCDHQGADEGQKLQAQQTVKDMEKQWRKILQDAQQVEAAAAAEIAQDIERRSLEMRELDTHQSNTDYWIEGLQQQMVSLVNQTKPEDRLHVAQAIMSSKAEGDYRIQKLRSLCQSVCSQDLGKQKKQDLEQRLQDSEEQWARLLKNAKQAMSEAERECALDLQIRNFEALNESIGNWLKERQKDLMSLDNETDLEQVIKMSQNILSLKPEGDSKLSELTRHSQSLSEQEGRQEISVYAQQKAQKAAQDSEELWKKVLQTAETTLLKAEVHYSLSRAMGAFRNHADNTKGWIKDLDKQAECMQGGMQGSKAQLEERMKTAQVILNFKSNGESQVVELKRRAQSLCDYAGLPEDKRMEAQQIVQDVEIQWGTVLQTAEETYRQLQGVMDRLLSWKFNQDQAEALLAEIQKQASSLPQIFTWPGLGDRRQAVEQAQTLLEQSTALASVFSDVHSQAEDLYEITQDQVWIEPSWRAKEEAIPALLKQLTDVVANLEQGIVMERQCTLLIEQHEAAQDWLREQVKGLGPPPTDRSGLYNSVNTLKALLLTVDREQRDMMELDSAKDCLLSLCTPEGQDAITLEVRYLHELCAKSEHEVRKHLTTCERRLEEMDCELAQISQELKERAAALQWELRSLDQAFSYSEPQNNIAQLQQHWLSLQNCENSLLDLGVKVQDLYQEVKSAPYTNELPAEIISLVESLCQQHTSLEFRLSDHQGACSTNTAHYLRDSISIMQQWTHSNPSDLVSSVQMARDEVENLQHNLHEALSHQQFLTACLTQDLFEKFKKECLETLEHVDAHKNFLNQSLKEIEQRGKQLPDTRSLDMSRVKLVETKSTVVAPPRKNKSFHEKQSASLPKTSTSVMDELLVQTEEILKTSLKPALEVSKSATCEEISLIPSRRNSKCLETEKELVYTEVESDMRKAINTHCSDIGSSEPKIKFEPSSIEARGQILLSNPSDAKLQQNQDYFKIAPSGVTTVEKNTSVVCPQFVQGYPEITLLRQKEVQPPRQKSISPKFSSKYLEQQMVRVVLTELSHGEESKHIPIIRKSKTAVPAATCMKVAFDKWSTEVDPEDNKTPVSLESSDLHRESEKSETSEEEKDKPSPAKRRLKGQETPIEHISKTLAESHPHPNSDKSLQSSKEQQQVLVEETEIIPSCRRFNLEVQLELNYAANITPSLDPDDTQQESNFATETFIDSPFLSPRRKSEKTELCIVQAFQMDEAEGNTSFQFEQNNNESMAQGSSDELKELTDSSLKDKGKFSPTKCISGPSKPLQDTIAKHEQDKLMWPEGQNPSEETETILTEIAVIPINSDVSVSVQPATMGTYNLESNETKKEIGSGKATDQEEHEPVLTTRSNSLVSYRDHFNKKKAQGMENDQIRSGENERQTEVLVVESVNLIQNKRLSECSRLPLEHLTNDQVPSSEKHDAERSRPPSTEQTDFILAGTELRQTGKDVTRVEPSAGPELLCATETHTDVVTTHLIEKHNIIVLTMAENNSKDIETVAEDISSEKKNAFQDQDQQEKEKATVDLDTGERFLQLLDSSFHKVETCVSAHANGSKADISYSSSIPCKTFDAWLQESEHKAKETLHQTTSQSSERDLDMVLEEQCLVSSDTTNVSTALQPEIIAVETGALEMKETRKELNTERDSSTQPSDTLTTDQEEYEYFTTTTPKSFVVTPETFHKEETLVTKAPDRQIAEATIELMYFRGQPELIGSVINEQSPDKTEPQNLGNSDKNKTQSQCEESPSRTQEDRGPFSTSVVGLTQISLTKQKSESLKNIDEMKVSGTKTENGNIDNQTVVQHSVVAEETKVQILEDETLQGMKAATIILDTREKCMGKASYLRHELDTCALSHHAKENEEDISAIPLKSCQESEQRVRGCPQQTIAQSSERDLETASKVHLSFSSGSIHPPNIANYILNLWKNTDKIEKRYLILDVPAAAFNRINEIELNQPDTEFQGKYISNRHSSAVSTLALSQEERTELTEIHLTENENFKLRGTVNEQKESEHKASQKIYEMLKESSVHVVKEIKEEVFAQKEPDCILDLNITSSPEVTDNTCVTGDETIKETVESIIQEDITEKTSVEIKAPGLEAAMVHMTEPIEISFYEQDQIHQIETRLAKECSFPVKRPTLLTHNGDAKSVTLERSQILTEVCILQLDIQSSQEESDPTSIEEEKETVIDIDRTHNQSEKYIESLNPEEATSTMSETEIQDSSSQIVGNVGQASSVQLTSFGYESVHSEETRVIEICLNDIGHREKQTKIELLRTKNEKAGPGKRHSFMKDHPEMAAETPDYFSNSLGEKSKESEKTHKEPEEQEAQQASGQEKMFVKVEEPDIDGIRAELQQTHSSVSQDDSSQPLSSCDADTVLDDKRTSEQGHFNTEVMNRQDICRTIEESHGDLSQKLNDNSITEKGKQLLILQPETQVQKTTSVVTIAKMPKTDPNETCIQGQRGIEKQNLISIGVYPEEMLMVDLKQQAFFEAKKPEIDNKEKIQDYKQLESGNGTLPEVDKDPGVAEQPSKLVIQDTDVGPETFHKNFIENAEIFVSPFDVRIADTEKQLGMVPCINTDSVKESQDAALAKVQQGFERNEEDVQETFTERFMSQPSLVQTYKHSTDAKEKIEQQVTETEESTVRADLQLQTPDDQVKLQTVNLPKIGSSAEEKLTESLGVEKFSSDIAPVTYLEELAAQEHGTRLTNKSDLKESESTTADKIFTEIQQLLGTKIITPLIEVKLHKNEPEDLIIPTSHFDLQLSRLASTVFHIKNSPTELNPKAMALQVEEVQQGLQLAQLQISLLPQLREANAEIKDILDQEDQWVTMAQDAAAVIQNKQAQLQLITDYCKQREMTKMMMDQLTAELHIMKISPQESCFKEVKRLCCFQRRVEENRVTLGELLMTHAKICLHLNRLDQETAKIEQSILLEMWRALETNVEKHLYHANVHSHYINTLLTNLHSLQEHVNLLWSDLKAKRSLPIKWSCKEAQIVMELNAEIEAARQQYLHLQQLSEELLHGSQWKRELEEINNKLKEIKNVLCLADELLLSQTKNSSNPIMEKIITVIRDGLAWAKQMESGIEGRRKWVHILPEDVHWQLSDLKKIQSEVMARQGLLESLVEEVTELLPQLDQAQEVPFVHISLEHLEELSKFTTDKLSKAIKELESGLQMREKLSEQMADLDSWIVVYLQTEVSRCAKSEPISYSDLDHKVCQVQKRLAEGKKQAAICEGLLMKSKDIAVELSVTENCQLFDKIRKLQEEINNIINHEKAQKEEMDQLIKTVQSRKNTFVSIEKSLRQMSVEMSRLRLPIKKDALQLLKPLKLLLLEHKSQVDCLIPWTPQEQVKEINYVILELQNKIASIEMKSRDHENYLNIKQVLGILKENLQHQINLTRENSMVEKYKICHSLLIQFSLMKGLHEQASYDLELISADLLPSQLTAEQQRLKETEDIVDTWEITLFNNLSLIELSVLKELDLESMRNSTQDFLSKTLRELQRTSLLKPNQVTVDKEYQRFLSVKKVVELQMRAFQVLEQKKGSNKRRQYNKLMDLKNSILNECDSKMGAMLKTRDCLRSYTLAVNKAVQFLQDKEVSLLPLQGSTGPCCERIEETQHTLASLQHQFQAYIEELQKQAVVLTSLSCQRVGQLQERILSQLLVRMSTLLAQGHIQLENLHRCAEQHRNHTKSRDEILKRVANSADRLLQQTSQKVTCLADCTDQEERLTALSEELESIMKCMENMREWCSEMSCRGGREAAVTTIWRWVSRLYRCVHKLTERSKQRIAEWLEIANSIERASAVLKKVEAELPDASEMKVSTEELQELLQSWEQYQERLDCEHRALSALELRTARLLGVPAHLEQAPPLPLCQRLQLMQGQYRSVGQKSKEGLLAARLELDEREKIREEQQVVHVWLEDVKSLLSKMEQSSSTHKLQELYRQLCAHKSLLQHIMENLKIKYAVVPVEIDSQMQKLTKSLHYVEEKVAEAVERSGAVHRLGTKLSDVQVGLRSVQNRMKERSPTVTEAKITQKRVWDELDVWHSQLAALEVEMQDLEKPEEVLILTEKLVEVQQLHSQVAKEAEQRTTLLSKIHTWLQEHQEMIKSSRCWMTEAQSWLAAPCTYTRAKCLRSHVHALQIVLGDASQIRSTLQNFSSVLEEMSQVCDITVLHDQLLEADHRVSEVHGSFTVPLSQLEHAAAEMEAMEKEVYRMENDVAEIKTLLSSPETFPSPREDNLKNIKQRIQSMKHTVAEIQKCKPGLCLPEKAEERLTVFNVVEQLQTLLLDLEKKVLALFSQQPSTPNQAKVVPAVQNSMSEQHGELPVEETTENKGNEELSLEEDGGSVFWWLWESFLGVSPEKSELVVSEEKEGVTGLGPGQTAEDGKDIETSTDTAEASSSEALSEALDTVRTQSLLVNTASSINISQSDARPQHRCVVS
ncbi:nesprin-2-like isoform X3 [Gambusia affinis]|uniref:nesprin-2-like isoform X3 n=1 Tax=Gambusia affinis TaxID=33528 RepID=UPI001CDD66C1|nr:nesprin-2-like isoform X3 [Gambusia affinis]